MKNLRAFASPALILGLCLALAYAQDKKPSPSDKPAAPVAAPAQAPAAKAQSTGDEALKETQRPSYPLRTCVVTGAKLGDSGAAVTDHVYEGRLVRLAGPDALKTFQADPAKYLALIDKAVIEQQKASYPLDKCVVSGEALDNPKEPAFDYVHGTRYLKLCCKDCVSAIRKDSAKFMAKVDEALMAAQLKTYPVEICLVSGEKFGGEMGEPVNMLYGTTLVRFCCKSCVKQFRKNPDVVLAKLEEARAKKAAR